MENQDTETCRSLPGFFQSGLHAQPAGSYRQTCSAPIVRGDTLSATCRGIDGKSRPPTTINKAPGGGRRPSASRSARAAELGRPSGAALGRVLLFLLRRARVVVRGRVAYGLAVLDLPSVTASLATRGGARGDDVKPRTSGRGSRAAPPGRSPSPARRAVPSLARALPPTRAALRPSCGRGLPSSIQRRCSTTTPGLTRNSIRVAKGAGWARRGHFDDPERQPVRHSMGQWLFLVWLSEPTRITFVISCPSP